MTTIASIASFGLLSSVVHAGSVVTDITTPAPVASSDGFAQARRPISNPTLFDLALPTTNVHPIVIFHGLPDRINTRLGPVPLGGDVEVYALQFEIAINERLSIVATKDGYVDMNPDTTLAPSKGQAMPAGGSAASRRSAPTATSLPSGVTMPTRGTQCGHSTDSSREVNSRTSSPSGSLPTRSSSSRAARLWLRLVSARRPIATRARASPSGWVSSGAA